jgi:hypothetical protein
MTEQEEVAPATDDIPAELEVPFTYPVGETTATRNIWVRTPRPEQILVWQRTLDQLGNAPAAASWTGSEVMKALERLRKIIDSLMVNKADVTWLDDQFLDLTLEFKDLVPFINQVVAAFQQAAADYAAEHGTRDERRAAAKTAKPAKKATRKAAGK